MVRSTWGAAFTAIVVLVATSSDLSWSAERRNPFNPDLTSPARDASDLAVLAPPSNRATATGSYGDGPVARSRIPRAYRDRGREPGDTAPVGVYFCRRNTAGTDRTVCLRDPNRVGFRQSYIYTPSYATAPQVGRGPVNTNPVLPPASAFFYSANSVLFGNPTDE